MPLTVTQVLESTAFSGASVVAGAKGLSNPIRWVHLCEAPDSGQLLSGNELVLTTGVSLKTKRERMDYIQGLALAKVAAVVIFLGSGFSRIPDYWRELADEWGIPIIVAPPDKSYIAVTEEVGKLVQAEAKIEGWRRRLRPESVVTHRSMAFFQDVLTGEILGRSGLELIADRLGLPSGGTFSAVVFRMGKEWPQPGSELYRVIAQSIEVINRSSLAAWLVPVGFWRQRITIVISTGDKDPAIELRTATTQLKRRFQEQFPDQGIEAIGIGRPYPIHEVPKSYREAKLASAAGHELFGSKPALIQYFGDLGLYRLLYAVEDKRELVSFYRESIAKLAEYDRTYKNDLLKTLQVYFRHEGNLRETAEALYIHRHTLRYRLKRVEELPVLNLNRFEHRLTLLLGLMIWQMLKGERESAFYPYG